MHNLQPDSWIGNWTVPVKCTTTSIWPLYLQFIYNLTNNLQFAQIGNWTVPVKCTTAEWEHIVFAGVRGISILHCKGLFIEKFSWIIDISSTNDLVNSISILKVFSLESFHGLWIFRAQMILWTQFWHLIIWDIFGQWEHIVFSGRERHLYSKGLFIALNNNFNRGIFREVAWIMDILSTNDLHRFVTEMQNAYTSAQVPF